MEIKDWIPLFSTVVIVIFGAIGWYKSSQFNNQNEIAKERRKHRIDTLQSVFSLLSDFQEASATDGQISHLNRKIRDTFTAIYIFGEKDEINSSKKVREALNSNNNKEFYESFEKFANLACNNIRKELLLPELPKDILRS